MKILVSKRKNGNTTALIKESARTGAIIVVSTLRSALCIKELATEMGLCIPDPIPPFEFIRRSNDRQRTDRYLIDGLQTVLNILKVDLATVDIDSTYILYK